MNSVQDKLLTYRDEENGTSYYLALADRHITEENCGALLEKGAHLQILVGEKEFFGLQNLQDEVGNASMVIRCSLTGKSLYQITQQIIKGALGPLVGEDLVSLRSFSQREVLGGDGPISYLLEQASISGNLPKVLLVAKVISKKQDHSFKIWTKEDVVQSRIENPSLLHHTSEVDVKLKSGSFCLHSFYSLIDQCYHWAFVKGFSASTRQKIPLVRIESECLTGHIFGSMLCDCGQQLEKGLELINNEDYGALIYLRQEGRGIGLINKIKAYRLQQEKALDTVDANLALGEPEDARDYLIGAQILKYFNIDTLNLLTNNPSKVVGLQKYGIKVKERRSHIIPASKHNKKYLDTKKDRMGHLM